MVRVGESLTGVGKSTFLNHHVVNNEHFFSCRMEAGNEFGPPLQRPGLTEFTRLAHSTAADAFWQTFGPSIEGSAEGDVYLANLHGDASTLPHALQLLLPYSSAFIVFWKAANWTELREARKEVASVIGKRDNVLSLILDPDETILAALSDEQSVLYSSQLHNQNTAAKHYAVFKEALKKPGVLEDARLEGNSLVDYVPVTTSASETLLEHLNEHSTPTIRALFLLLQTELRDCKDEAEARGVVSNLLTQHPPLTLTLTAFIRVLNLPLASRFNALTHLRLQLEQLTESNTLRDVERILSVEGRLSEHLGASRAGETPLDEGYVLSLQNELKGAIHRKETLSLGLGHFWAALDYVIPLHVPQMKAAYHDTYAQLVEEGWVLRLQDGEDGARNPQLLDA